jgi:hypothetical protein
MSASTLFQQHHQLCDEIHACVLEENHFLRQHQRAPDNAFLEKKRELLARLDLVVEGLRKQPAASARDADTRARLETTRARILQILQLDKENEQLLLRCSLSSTRPAGSPPKASASMLQKIYSRVS